ncbi:MAG: hypothetical protein JW863_18970 [Chitinispirillaceae bacterium]|nr:hypothetical protein [Chitinispirillaceae bacterium]
MKQYLLIAAVAVITGTVFAADPSEAGVPLKPLKIYSGGIGIGAVRSLNEELKEASLHYLSIALPNTFSIRDHVALFLDAEWMLPGKNFGADLGVDAVLSRSDIRPFFGIGLGGRYIDRGHDFGDDFGPSITAHGGCTIDLSDNVALRVRIPYHLILTETVGHTIGLECGLMFSSRFKKVRKLDYN